MLLHISVFDVKFSNVFYFVFHCSFLDAGEGTLHSASYQSVTAQSNGCLVAFACTCCLLIAVRVPGLGFIVWANGGSKFACSIDSLFLQTWVCVLTAVPQFYSI